METELRLGLPGGGGGRDHHDKTNYSLTTTMSSSNITTNAHGKRCYDETVDLKLNLSDHTANMKSTKHLDKDSVKIPAAKAQVVGWPPVRSYRKNVIASQKSSGERQENSDKQVLGNGGAALVKVSMDGAPYLRKVDLNMYKTYQDLSHALANMFSSFTIGNCEVQGMKDFMNESKLMDLLNTSEYVPTYEDKDGDWMLVGDVPWRMFVESCKRLRIMKGTEAKGLAPKAMEKCKNRN